MSGCALSYKSVQRVNREHGTAFTYMATIGGDPSWCRATSAAMQNVMVYFDRRSGALQDDHKQLWVRSEYGWKSQGRGAWPNWMLTE